MPYNGSGTFTNVAGNPVVTGTIISSTVQNNTTSDYATGLTTALCKDGQSVPTANLPMGGFKLTGLSVTPTARTDSAALATVQNSQGQQLGTIAGTNTITAQATPTLTAYANGQTFRFLAAGANTGATTLNVDSVGAKNIFWNGVACAGGEIAGTNNLVTVTYDGTQFNLQTNTGASTPPFSDATGLVKNSSDATKIGKLSAASITTGTTRTYTLPDTTDTVGMETGLVGNARNLKMSATAANATQTFSADQVIVNTALGGIGKRLASYSQACNLGTTGAGGMDTGTAPISGFVSVYAICKIDGTTSILACAVATSTASIYGGANMPSGYTYSALIGIIPTDGSSRFKPGFLIDRTWWYQAIISIFTGTTGSSSLTSQSISSAVPTVARTVSGVLGKTSAVADIQGSVAGDTTGTGVQASASVCAATTRSIGGIATASIGGAFTFKDVPIITAQTIFWSDAVGSSTSFMNVSGYSV